MRLFFNRSYPTAGLKTLLRDVLARVSGTDANVPAIVR
jgi:predicted AAA+ superfamily ATPase